MSAPRVLILRAAGINCDEETAYAFEQAGAVAERIHVNRLLERPETIDDFAAVAVPGGFSYGDDISAGRVLAIEIGRVLGDRLRALIERGGLILGICNGFQVLVKSGLLPGPEPDGAPPLRATLLANESDRYEDRWVRLAVDPTTSLFFDDDEPIELPVAHAEGRFMVRDSADLERLESNHRVVLRYVNADGETADYPANPNGSVAGVAAICDATGHVLGLMPHPERFLEAWQHPTATRRRREGRGQGARLFETAVRVLRG